MPDESIDVDETQNEVQLISLKSLKASLEAQNLPTTDLDAAIEQLEALMAPPAEPEPVGPTSHYPPEYEDFENRRWKLWFYAGAFYCKPSKDSIHWNEFISRYGQPAANVPAFSAIPHD